MSTVRSISQMIEIKLREGLQAGRSGLGGTDLSTARFRRIAHLTGEFAVSAWRTIHSFGRGTIDTRRLEPAIAAVAWLAVLALISALIADAFR